jgi:hypothetical protein
MRCAAAASGKMPDNRSLSPMHAHLYVNRCRSAAQSSRHGSRTTIVMLVLLVLIAWVAVIGAVLILVPLLSPGV